MKYSATILITLGALIPSITQAVEIFTEMPSVINSDERYVIYSHGLIVEGDDPTPVSPDYGMYDFPGIKQAIFEGGNFNLIAEQRPKNADFLSYVGVLETWVKQLMEAGVDPSRITLVGFSRGSHITAYASDRLKEYGINTALLASCIGGDISKKDAPLVLGGDFLNVYETTDVAGSCEKIIDRSTFHSLKEIPITTGKRHGAFFQPLPEWISPLKEWISETNR